MDSVYSHAEYTKKPRKEGGLGGLDLPLLSDTTTTIAKDYGVLADGGNL